MSGLVSDRVESDPPAGTSADEAAMALAGLQAELLDSLKQERGDGLAGAADLRASQPFIGASIGQAIGAAANDADEASAQVRGGQNTGFNGLGLAEASGVATSIPIVGPIIAAVLAAIAAVMQLIQDMVEKGLEAEAEPKDGAPSPGDVVTDGGGEGGEGIAAEANKALAQSLDWFFDPPGNDYSGADRVSPHQRGDTIWGSANDDIIKSAGFNEPGTDYDTDGSNTIYGGDGNDVIEGGEGHDYVYGGTGNDTIKGGEDSDYLYGGDGYDKIWGDGGNDYIHAGADGAEAHGGEGNDWLFGGDGDDTLLGDAGEDHLFGYAGADWLEGGLDNDTLQGGGEADMLLGGGGDDLVFGGDGPDTIEGNAGNDVIHAGDGKDLVFGGADDDTIAGGSGQDDLYGDGGDDTILGGQGADYIDGGSGQDTFVYQDVLEFGDEIDGVDTAAGASDVFDFSKLFNGAVADVQQATAGGYLQWVQSGADVQIQIDLDGGGDGFVTAATLIGVDAVKVSDSMFIV